MKKRTDCTSLCSGAWLISSSSCGGVITFTPSREIGRGKRLYGCMYGRTAKVADWKQHEIVTRGWDDEALWRGYAEKHFMRPFAFISLRLTPRCRREARSILSRHGQREAFEFVYRMARPEQRGYIRTVIEADYMHKQRGQWERYLSLRAGEDYVAVMAQRRKTA